MGEGAFWGTVTAVHARWENQGWRWPLKELEFQAGKGWCSRSRSPSHNPPPTPPPSAASPPGPEGGGPLLDPAQPRDQPHTAPPAWAVILGPLVPPGGQNWYRIHEPLIQVGLLLWGSWLGGEVGAPHLPTVSVDLKVLCSGDWRVTMPGTQSLSELSSSSVSSSPPFSSQGRPSLRGI